MYTTRHILRTIILILILIAMLSTGNQVYSQSYNKPFTSAITYQNVGGNKANITFYFYAQGSGIPIACSQTINPGGALSLYVGNSCGISNNFQGSVRMTADQNIIATIAQISPDPLVKNRPLYNAPNSGATKIWLATVLKNTYNTNSIFSIQNVSTSPINISAKLYNAANPTASPIQVTRNNIPAGSTQYFDMASSTSVPGLPANFDGSAIVEATGAIVGTVLEFSSQTGYAAKAFEGISAGASKVFMSTALCNAFGGVTIAYAVQNISTIAGNVKVTYTNGTNETKLINPGAKQSFNTCTVNSAGYSAAATIESLTNGVLIIAVGKASKSADNTYGTAFVGETGGSSRLALPYVRYTGNSNFTGGLRQRAFIAIQNVGTTNATGIQVRYLNKNGDTVGIHLIGTLTPNAKASSNALLAGNTSQLQEFGNPDANPSGGYGGSAIIEGDGQLVAIGRISSIDTNTGLEVAEDYNAIQLQ